MQNLLIVYREAHYRSTWCLSHLNDFGRAVHPTRSYLICNPGVTHIFLAERSYEKSHIEQSWVRLVRYSKAG